MTTQLFTTTANDFDIIESWLSTNASPTQVRHLFEDYYSYIIFSDQKMSIMRMLSRVHETMVGEPLLYTE